MWFQLTLAMFVALDMSANQQTVRQHGMEQFIEFIQIDRVNDD